MQGHERTPNPLDFTPKYIWREVYEGHWRQLSKLQRTEFAVELIFCILFFGGFAYVAYFRGGDVGGFALAFGIAGALLGVFFWLLSRNIR